MMDNELRPYEEYKVIDLPWINEIPKRWDVKRNSGIWSERKEVNYNDEELLSVTIKRGVIRQSDLIKNTSKKDASNLDKSKYKLVLPDDIAYNKMRMWQGASGRSQYRGIVSPAYIILRPIIDVNSLYYHYLLRTVQYIQECYRNSYGICDDQLSLRYEDFKTIFTIIPPRPEQDQIVKYLDHKLAKINKFIKAKKKLIAVLKEQKQAIINEVVTKGLDPNVKMKPSGIEWLGDVPEHWEICKLKKHMRINPTVNHIRNKYSLEDKVVFLPMENISVNGEINNSEYRKIRDVKSGFTSFGRSDVIIAKITPCFENGKGACLELLETEIGYGTTELIVLRAIKDGMLAEYLYYITRSGYFRTLGSEVMTGSAGQKRVPTSFISNFIIGIPKVDEQKCIIKFINNYLNTIDNSIKMVEQELNLIMEYKNTLISDVVTGKVDVRNITINELEDLIIDELEPNQDTTEDITEDETLAVEDGEE